MSATNRGAVRRERDYYPTPSECTWALMKEIIIPIGSVLCEPCAGDGAIPDASNWPEWVYAEIEEDIDYLNTDFNFVDGIITNPPFSLAQEFLEKSLREADFVAYLLRLNFLGSQKRKLWWQDKTPTHLYVLSKRPSFTGNGTDATEYAWFVWDKQGWCKRDPNIYVI